MNVTSDLQICSSLHGITPELVNQHIYYYRDWRLPMSLHFPQDTISKFVATSVAQLPLSPDARILDIPCGFGRHARWFASHGYAVVGLDIDEKRISSARELSQAASVPIQWGVADIEKLLPFPNANFDVVVVVHYVSDHIIEAARRALKPDGYLIFETFDARGQNWRTLPLRGSIRDTLEHGFEIVNIHERAVGPELTHAVVRVLARRCDG